MYPDPKYPVHGWAPLPRRHSSGMHHEWFAHQPRPGSGPALANQGRICDESGRDASEPPTPARRRQGMSTTRNNAAASGTETCTTCASAEDA
ncbi:hypothetical protein CDD81_3260 [Ophiocordyceps australis]|uniref:Uncharacterized protein n=1 Tax=Ophiocordyceps australis TaxID=1399860 RepID=A0A2C5XAS4_9HYPO|nr:hypothetical protein CDD81_3260 [Ophiocordyceps australis]